MDNIEFANLDIAAVLPNDGRVTPAEYLERFNPELAECCPYRELPYWLRELHRRSSAADKTFGLAPTYNAEGTRTYHPHTLAWVARSMLDGNHDADGPLTSNRWLSSNTAAPLVQKTARERAECEPHFAWITAPEFIVDPFYGCESAVAS